MKFEFTSDHPTEPGLYIVREYYGTISVAKVVEIDTTILFISIAGQTNSYNVKYFKGYEYMGPLPEPEQFTKIIDTLQYYAREETYSNEPGSIAIDKGGYARGTLRELGVL
jgi:hypothetical protein